MFKSLLGSVLTVQLILSPSVLLAQQTSKAGGSDGSDIWSGASGCPTFWQGSGESKVCAPANSSFTQTTGGTTTGGSDPWGGWGGGGSSGTGGDVWNPGGMDNGGWSDATGGGFGGGYMGSYNMIPSYTASIINMTGVLNQDYQNYVANLRRSYAYLKTDDELAQMIIDQGVEDAKNGAYINAGTTALLTLILPAVFQKLTAGNAIGSMSMITSYVGFDYLYSIQPRAQMTLRLAALYDILPPTINARMALIDTMAVTDIAVSAAGVLGQSAITAFLAKMLDTEAAKAAIQASAGSLASDAITSTLNSIRSAAAAELTPTVEKAFVDAAAKLAPGQIEKNVAFLYLEKIKNFLATNLKVETKTLYSGLVAGAVVAYLSGKKSISLTRSTGISTHTIFKMMQGARIASAKKAIEASGNYSKQVLWLLVLRYAFVMYPQNASAQAKSDIDKERSKFLFALSTAFPLLKTKSIDERANIIAEFENDIARRRSPGQGDQANPRKIGNTVVPLIDWYLIKLSEHEDLSTRLFLFKILMEAMYVGKETLTDDDQMALDTISIELGLNLPPLQLGKLNIQDPRREVVASVDALKAQVAAKHDLIRKVINGTVSFKGSDKIKENGQHWGPSGTIFLEDLYKGKDYEQVGDAAVTGSITDETLTQNKATADKRAAEMCKDLGTCSALPASAARP